MTTLYEGAFAKINLTLDVLGKREDGYHDLQSVMQTVSIRDDIEIDVGTGEPWSLLCDKEGVMPCDERNLAWKAARVFESAARVDLGGIQIRIVKRIPSQAGMGGGSADAAGVLVGLNRLWGLNLPQEELEVIGLRLGADVPFCIRGGLTRTTGIGETMEDLPCGRCWPLVVIQPCEGLSTKEIFTAYHEGVVAVRPDNDTAALALAKSDAQALSAAMANVMQPVSEARRPSIREAIAALTEQGACAAQMTGSGSAVFGAFIDESSACRAYDVLCNRWERVYLCSTCMDSVVFVDDDQN